MKAKKSSGKLNSSIIAIINSEVEGYNKIIKIQGLRDSVLKLFFFVFLSVISVGGLWVISFFWPRIKKKMLYKETNDLRIASHFYIVNQDKLRLVVKK